MDKLFDTDLTIEKMAAYLDGNLSDDEMHRVMDLIGLDNRLKLFLDRSSFLDEAISGYTASELELPGELQTLDFSLPAVGEACCGHLAFSAESLMCDTNLAGCVVTSMEEHPHQNDVDEMAEHEVASSSLEADTCALYGADDSMDFGEAQNPFPDEI